MGQPAFGYEEYIGVGFELGTGSGTYNDCANFEDAEATPAWMRVVENSLTIDDMPIALPHMSGYPVERYCGAVAGTPHETQGVPKFSGTMTVLVEPNAIGPILWNALRMKDANYTPAGVAAPYTHTWAYIVSPETIGDVPSLTITRYNGQQQTTFTGVHINSLELTGSGEGPILLKFEPIPASYSTSTHPGGTVAFTTSPVLRMHESYVWYNTTIGSAADTAVAGVSSWTYRIENNLRTDPTASLIKSDGSTDRRYHQEPIPAAYRKFSFSMTKDWQDNTFQALWRSIRDDAYFYSWELGMDYDGNDYSLVFKHPSMRVVGDFPTHGGDAGPIPETINWEASVFYTGAAHSLGSCILENDEDDYTP